MSEQVTLEAAARTAVRHGVKALRRTGQVPGVVYGHNIAPSAIQLNSRDLDTGLRKAGRNNIIKLVVDGTTKMVLPREVQRDAIKHNIKHIDFYEVSMTEKLSVTVPVTLHGENADVKSGAGVVLQEIHALRIRCLPQNLIAKIEVNIGKIKLGAAVHVRELNVASGVEIMNDGDDEVVRIARYSDAPADGGAATGEVAVIEKGKKEDKAAGGAAKGAAPAKGGAAAPKAAPAKAAPAAPKKK
ncbi:MAG: 50S ribosomal protein L25 [Anaerolineae bacterium]|nr:50S ribosomal protein L25 [Anaerolineae bacterium]